MRTNVCAVLILVIVTMIAGTARGEQLAISEVRSEADVADEAGAISLLVRSALAGPDRALLAVPPNVTVGSAPATLAKLGAERVVLLDLAREGTGLRLSLAIAGGAHIEAAMIRSGDGDLQTLAQGVVDRVATSLSITPSPVRDLGLAQLRPFVIAIRLAGSDPAAASRALAEANPLNALSITAAEEALRGLPARVDAPVLSAIAARALRDLAHLDKLGAGTDATALAARAFAAILRTNLTDVETMLKTASRRGGLFAMARITLAERRGDIAVLAERIKEGLASDQLPGVLAAASLVDLGRLPVSVQRAVLGYVEKRGVVSSGIASRIGLAVALAGTEPARALALVSVREHDKYEVKQLESVLGTGSGVTVLRLRAELAMRRSDGSEKVAVGELLKGAPEDPLAHRYQGWLMMGEERYLEAAVAFDKAGQLAERGRTWLASNNLVKAASTFGGPPTTAEQLVIAARVALSNKQLDEAARLIALAETSAPVSPEVHATVIQIGSADAARIEVARLIVSSGTTKVAVGGAAPPTAKTTPIGSAAGGAEDAAPVRAKDIAIDPTPLLPLLEAFPALTQLPDRAVVIVELSSDPPWYSLRQADAAPVDAGLAQLVSAQPYGLRLGTPARIESLGPEVLARLTETTPTALIYSVVPDGGSPKVTLTLFHRGATDAQQFSSTITMPGVVGWDTSKLIPVGGLALLLTLGGGLWLTRFLNKIVVEIERAPDVDDEVLCVVVTRSEHRPMIGDPAKFRATTKKAGARSSSRSATLIVSGETFRVSSGRWYVHLYGTFMRGNELRTVPETCSEAVEVKRGERVEVVFNLTSKLAEITLLMETEPKRGVAVWANDATHDKRYSDASGAVKLQLPIGTHTVHIDVEGKQFERVVQVVSSKMQRITFNVARELRIAQGIAFDANEDVRAELELAPGEAAIAMPTGKRSPIETDKTHLPPAIALPPEPVIRLKPRAKTPIPGELLLGRYKIQSELGRGAMGVVHRAMDEKLEREVAIKEMADDLHSNPEAMRLFTQEAKALAQLNHTNIVGMYDQITETEKVYMIMEFVDGKPLADILEARGTFNWRDAVAIIDQVCAGLAYAHARKVVHRDIKPANIFVTKDRTAKLGDFGLARVMREVTIQRTEIRGTPLYMAPEQIKGTDVDHRTDLYAIGCTFFELVTGRPPFIDGDILYAQMHSPPPSPRELTPDLPEALDALILSLLAKSSDDRPGSANEVRAVLKAL